MATKRSLHFLLVAALAVSWVSAFPAAADTVRYVLEPPSTLCWGCLSPCSCPETCEWSMTGTFLLTSMPPEDGFSVFVITDVQWLTSSDRVVTGSGTLRIRNDAEPLQRLEIDLLIDGVAQDHYDSDVVPTEAGFPDLSVTAGLERPCWFELVQLAAHPESDVLVQSLTWGRVKSLY